MINDFFRKKILWNCFAHFSWLLGATRGLAGSFYETKRLLVFQQIFLNTRNFDGIDLQLILLNFANWKIFVLVFSSSL